MGYGYSRYDVITPAAGFAAAAAVLLLIALIVAVVVTVVLYRKYVATPKDAGFLRDKAAWGPFLRFDRMIIYNVLCALYIFCASFTLFAAIALVLAGISLGIGGFLAVLAGSAVACVVLELVERVGFEATMLLVRIARNTTAIKNSMCGSDDEDPFAGMSQPYAPVSPAWQEPEIAANGSEGA